MSRPSSFSSRVTAPGIFITDGQSAALQLADHQQAAGNLLFVSDWLVSGKVVAEVTLDGTNGDYSGDASGDRTLNFDADGADRKILLYGDSVSAGVTLRINNTGGSGNLVLRDSTDASTIGTVYPGQGMDVSNDSLGTGWQQVASVMLFEDAVYNAGAPGSALISIETAATDGDTITIGADIYEFVTAAANISDDTRIAVVASGNALTDLTALVAAINGAGTAIADGCLDSVGATPGNLIEDGTESLFARVIDGKFCQIIEADAVGGNPVTAAASVAVSESTTATKSKWSTDNINIVGQAPSVLSTSVVEIIVAALSVVAGTTLALLIPFSFTPTMFTVNVRDANGVLRGMTADAEVDSDDAFTIMGSNIMIAFGATATVDLVATDVITIQAWG